MPVNTKRKGNHIGRHVEQGSRTPVQASAGCDKFAKMATLNILQLNIAGLQNKTTELEKLLHDNGIHVVLLQETILPSREISTPAGYTTYPCKCGNCQGIMTLIRTDIQGTVYNCPIDDIDIQEISVWFGNEKFNIYNVYCPPLSKVDFSLRESVFSKTIVAGDFNAHLPALGYDNFNHRGYNIEDILNSSNLYLHQDLTTEPTLLHRRHCTSSRPDLTITSSDICERTSIKVLEGIGSDHKPIQTEITTRQRTSKLKKGRKCLWNFRKANWNKFKDQTDEKFSEIPAGKSIEETYSLITSAILESAKSSIPKGNRKRYSPFWTK